jgi:hypothetical protein
MQHPVAYQLMAQMWQWKWRPFGEFGAADRRGAWRDFQPRAARQLERVLPPWFRDNGDARTLVVTTPDGRLRSVWHELQQQSVCSIRMKVGHHVAYITACGGGGEPLLEVCRVLPGTVEYPCVWDNSLPGAARVDIDSGTPDWDRIQTMLRCSLPGAVLTRLERVQNRRLWGPFYNAITQHCHDGGGSCTAHAPVGEGVQELWHATGAVDAICCSDTGFDIRRAHKHGLSQAVLDKMGVGGHVYGRGAYFARHPIYSHWWSSTYWQKKDATNHRSVEFGGCCGFLARKPSPPVFVLRHMHAAFCTNLKTWSRTVFCELKLRLVAYQRRRYLITVAYSPTQPPAHDFS